MNRTTSLFLALGLLVTHSFALHHTDTGRWAPAYDEVHVAFRVARHVVRNGLASWNADVPSLDAYRSPLWVALCWIPERLYRDPALFSQSLGILSALATSVVVSRFSRNRLAGIIAPLLLVLSGAFASAAASGNEATLLALLLTGSFLSLERRRGPILAAFLTLTVATRPEGFLFVIALLALELLSRRAPDRPGLVRWFVPAFVLAALLCVARLATSGHWLSPTTAAILTVDGERVLLGWSYLSDFLLKSGSAWLLLFPLVSLVLGSLRGTALRALVLALAWFALVVWTGGDALPMWNALVPALPLFFVAVQEGMTTAMDRGLPALTWSAFVVALIGSALVSKRPSDIGTIPIADVHFAAMEPSDRVRVAYDAPLGRTGLRVKLRSTERLRSIGNFLRTELDPELEVVTPWPGAIGYMSRRRVHDLLGRTGPLPGEEQTRPWFGNPKADLLARFLTRPDHLVLNLASLRNGSRVRDVIGGWLRRWDRVGDRPERVDALLSALRGYELVTIPIEDRAGSSTFTMDSAFYLLRRDDIGLAAELVVETAPGGAFRALVRHDGYDQLADLVVQARGAGGRTWSMRPNGEFTLDTGVSARSRILLHQTVGRSILLAEGRVPARLGATEVTCRLHNPGVAEHYDFARIGDEVSARLVE